VEWQGNYGETDEVFCLDNVVTFAYYFIERTRNVMRHRQRLLFLSFFVFCDVLSAQVPRPSNRSWDSKWSWSLLEYRYRSSLPSSAMSAVAEDWNGVKGLFVIFLSSAWRDIDVRDDNSISPNRALTLIFTQSSSTCAWMEDTCGRCMTGSVI
jgi:hypothetical protein